MSEETKIVCTYCGSENPAHAKFCSNCGVSLQVTEEINIDYGPAEETYQDNVQYETYSNSQSQYYSEPFAAEAEQKLGGGYIGIAIASMVCGIISILCCCMWLFGMLLSIAAIVLGIVAIVQKYDGKGMAVAGIVTGGVGFILSAFWLLVMGLNTITAASFF